MGKHNKKMLNELKARLIGVRKEVGKNKRRTKDRIRTLRLQKVRLLPFF
jgi:hypothetical protein